MNLSKKKSAQKNSLFRERNNNVNKCFIATVASVRNRERKEKCKGALKWNQNPEKAWLQKIKRNFSFCCLLNVCFDLILAVEEKKVYFRWIARWNLFLKSSISLLYQIWDSGYELTLINDGFWYRSPEENYILVIHKHLDLSFFFFFNKHSVRGTAGTNYSQL